MDLSDEFLRDYNRTAWQKHEDSIRLEGWSKLADGSSPSDWLLSYGGRFGKERMGRSSFMRMGLVGGLAGWSGLGGLRKGKVRYSEASAGHYLFLGRGCLLSHVRVAFYADCAMGMEISGGEWDESIMGVLLLKLVVRGDHTVK